MKNFHAFVQNQWNGTDEWKQVTQNAFEFINFLNTDEVIAQIKIANQPSSKSSKVQDVLLNKALELGFVNESKGLFSDYKNHRLRPDYFLKLPNNTGILMEVERGKTNQNNMDFLDFWKCHICKHAHYLFLIVPFELRQNSGNKVSGRPFETVIKHIEPLFITENYTNVRGVFVIGY
jgi:hypothetical protein